MTLGGILRCEGPTKIIGSGRHFDPYSSMRRDGNEPNNLEDNKYEHDDG
jgi:hypothetical protein